jgi:hypothetical protein
MAARGVSRGGIGEVKIGKLQSGVYVSSISAEGKSSRSLMVLLGGR